MPITRYHFERTRKHDWIVVKHDQGPWVTFEDHYTVVRGVTQAKDARIKELEEELARVNLSYDVDMRAWKERIEDLEKQIAENR